MSCFFPLKAQSLVQKKKKRKNNPTFYSPENHPVYKVITSSPSSHRLFWHQRLQPLHSQWRQGNATFKIHCFLRGRVLSAAGTRTQSQCGESLRGTRKYDPKRPETLFPATVESASGLEFHVLSNMTRLRLLGTVKCSQMPTKRLCPEQEKKVLAGF